MNNARAKSPVSNSNHTVFVTGAAAGIGAACADAFHKAGWFVGLYDTNLDGCRALADKFGERCIAGRLDVTDPADWQAALEQFWNASGQRLDVLLNNAGILAAGNFEQIDLARQHAIVDVNIKGVMNGCHAAFEYLQQTSGARVINMASASALYGQPELATYAASKFAVRGLTEGLNLEWAAHGIHVCDIWPLFTQTAMMETAEAAASAQNLPKRLSPDEVAGVVLQAATSNSRKVHWLVGSQAKLLALVMKLSPAWLVRAIVGRLTKRQ